MKQKTKIKALSWLLSLAMLLSLLPGMGLTAYAATDTYTTLKNNVTVVHFNNYDWYIIEDNSTSATKGTVTLLAADNKFGLSTFSDSESSVYSSSKIKAALDAMTQEGGAFADVADAIVSTDLEDVSVTGAKLYLLSTGEAQNLNSTILNYNFPGSDKPNAGGAWWLRSPGSSNSDKYAACVFGSTAYTVGNVSTVGNKVSWNYGVRPALKLNLESVIFSSESNSFSLKPAHTHSFTYTADGDTITATCGADGCTLPPSSEGGNDHVATLTIAAPTTGNDATITVSPAGALTGYTVKYQTKSGDNWSSETETAPSTAGIHKASITLTGTDSQAATASVSYGNNCITYATELTHGSISGDTGATCGATITPNIMPDEGYELDALTVTPEEGSGVSASDITVNGGTFVMPEANVTVSATFKKINRAITVTQPTTGGTVTAKIGNDSVTSADYGDTITLGNTPADGYSFTSYSVTKTGDSSTTVLVSNGTFAMPEYPVTVTGTFSFVDYTVTAAATIEHGTVTPDKTSGVHIGDVVTLTVNPAEGYEIDTLTVTKEGGGDVTVTNNKFTMPAANVNVSATFKKINSAITIVQPAIGGSFAVNNGSTALSSGDSADYGDNITLSNTPATGFSFVSYKVTKTGDENTTLDANSGSFSMPAYPVTVSATFEGQPFAVTTVTDPTIGGTVSVTGDGVIDDGTKAKAGTEVTLNVTPAAGFDLISDSVTVTKEGGGEVTVTNNTFTMPTEAVTVSATFAGHDTTATLSVAGNEGTTCTAKLLNSSYEEIDSVTKKGGEQFILLVNRDEGYDFNVTYGTDSPVTLTEFTEDEYKAYVAYAKDNNITVPSNMVLAWVTMPGVTEDSVTLTVDFSKLQTFTILYQPTGNPDNVWCKFAVNSGVDGNNTASSQMKSDATMGDGSQVYSLKVTLGFAPTSVAFAATKDDVDGVTNDGMTACSTKTGTSDSDWTTISSGKFCVIGGDAKTVIVAFVSDASNMEVYNSDTVEVDKGTGTDGVTYRVAIVTDGSAGTVTAPANALTKEGYDFAGWRGFEGTAPNKTEKIYNAGDSISVSENTTLNAVWNLKKSTVTLNLNGGTGNSSVDPVTYGEKLPTLENPTRSGFAFDGWIASETVTEDGTLFAKGSPFDLSTNITADLGLTAQWKHVHSYTCYRVSTFGDALAAYAEYDSAIHVAICGCNDIQLMAHEFDESGKCACGYQKPEPDVTLNISYGQWSNGAYTEKMKGMPETAKQGHEVSICAPDAWGDLQFSKWQYSTDNSTWYDLTADAYASFLIPATMYVRALYVNPVTVPQVDLSARQYDDHTVVNGQTYTMDNILFQMNYKLPDGYTFVDAGIRLGDNAGISYYELKEITYTANSEAKALIKGFAALGVLVSVDPTNARLASLGGSSETKTFYEVHKNSVLDEMTAAELAKHMYECKPINVEKYDPIYWEAKAKTKGMSGSMATLPPLRFAQKDNQDHWIYGIGWLRYKDKDGNIQTIYTEALATTVNGVLQNSTGTVTKVGN